MQNENLFTTEHFSMQIRIMMKHNIKKFKKSFRVSKKNRTNLPKKNLIRIKLELYLSLI